MKVLYILCSVLVIGLISACTTKKNKAGSTTHEESIKSTSQENALQERKIQFGKTADQHTKAIYQDGLNAVAKSGLLKSAKNVGDKAPLFTLNNALGKSVSLSEYLKEGPVILVWYRGGWCPYCNINLQYLQQELPNFKAQGASLLALTPELPDRSISTSEKHDLKFEVLSDVGNIVAKNYGIVFKLTDDVARIYNQKFGLNDYNGDTSNELPLAATYIINTDGEIVYAFLDADYRNRAEPAEITAFLKEMK